MLPGNSGHLPYVGFSLWNYPRATACVKLLLVVAGAAMYWRAASEVSTGAAKLETGVALCWDDCGLWSARVVIGSRRLAFNARITTVVRSQSAALSGMIEQQMHRREALRTISAHAFLVAKSMSAQAEAFQKGARTTMETMRRSASTPSLNLAYEQAGPDFGQAIVLLHGSP